MYFIIYNATEHIELEIVNHIFGIFWSALAAFNLWQVIEMLVEKLERFVK